MSNKIKENGVVYTPSWVVEKILDLSYFTNNIYDKKVLEPGCGDGAFLTEIVKRVIIDALAHGLDKEKISELLSNNIFGFDIDQSSIDACLLRLNKICQENFINLPVWKNIKTADLLDEEIIEIYKNQFDFVFGNPPYVRIQNLGKKARDFVNKHLKCCQHGSTDLYIAFFELGYKFLNDKGTLGFITPNTFISSAAGRELRNHISNAVYLLVDFEHYQVFNDASTYSLITVLSNNLMIKKSKLYKGNASSINNDYTFLDIKRFERGNWVLEDEIILDKIDSIKKQGSPLTKIAEIHTGLATLKDELFIFKSPIIHIDQDRHHKIATITLKDGRTFEIEARILKKIIKASKWKGIDQKLFIIFPYQKINGKYEIIPETEMKQEFPLTLKYFKSVRKELDQRDKGDKNKLDKYPAWYAFGRSQGIDTSFGKKIITAAINLKPNFIVCEDEDTTYYAGYSIHYNGDLYKLAEKLNSSDMEFYIKYSSRDYQGAWKSYSKSFIEDFGIDFS